MSLLLLLLTDSVVIDAADASLERPRRRSLRRLQAATGAPTAMSPTPAPSMSEDPTAAPTLLGTAAPSESRPPSAAPTPIFLERKRFSQFFEVENNTFFTEAEEVAFQDLFQGYTAAFAPPNETDYVRTEALILAQKFTFSDANATASAIECIVDYSMEYRSTLVDVAAYPDAFLSYMNDHLANVTRDLQSLGLDVTRALETQFVQVESLGPTATAVPSVAPPSTSPPPIATVPPTSLTFAPSPGPADPSGNGGGRRRVALPVVAALTVLSGMAALIAIVWCTKRNRRLAPARRAKRRGGGGGGSSGRRRGATDDREQHYDGGGGAAAGAPTAGPHRGDPDELSLVSEGATGNRSVFSGDLSVDDARHLQDEFDQYKDQNLEELRTNVETNLSGFEGIMCAAVTKALMGDEDAPLDADELLWGCEGTPSAAEIEASALVEVSDWLKRNEEAPVERRRAFMQDILTRMVATVRFGAIEAEDASRTIHEAAALLGLQLANELPMTTVIISGMRKTVEAAEIVKTLDEFGDIDNVAVASGKRGFGIVRFRHPKSVERAMRRYRSAEIVVQDVAVQMKVLMPSGEVLSRA